MMLSETSARYFIALAERTLASHDIALTAKKKRILEEILNGHGSFDAESVYLRLCNQGRCVSRSTVYNTLAVLVRAGLLIISHDPRRKFQIYHLQCQGITLSTSG
jgi:Fe2+ or Zn2+ uptake regulation protein